MTIVVVTHELASAYLIADRMVLIDKGNVLSIGTTEEMRSSSQPRVVNFWTAWRNRKFRGNRISGDAHRQSASTWMNVGKE